MWYCHNVCVCTGAVYVTCTCRWRSSFSCSAATVCLPSTSNTMPWQSCNSSSIPILTNIEYCTQSHTSAASLSLASRGAARRPPAPMAMRRCASHACALDSRHCTRVALQIACKRTWTWTWSGHGQDQTWSPGMRASSSTQSSLGLPQHRDVP